MATGIKSSMKPVIERSAVFSPCRTWRYTLDRHWNGHTPRNTVLFVLLNPSTADEEQDDPTNRRALKYAQRWGYNGCVFVNLFSSRTPYPQEMKQAENPIGPDNDQWIQRRAAEAQRIICAWGAHGTHMERAEQVRALLAPYDTWCMGVTKGGEPRHILYLPADFTPQRYTVAEE